MPVSAIDLERRRRVLEQPERRLRTSLIDSRLGAVLFDESLTILLGAREPEMP